VGIDAPETSRKKEIVDNHTAGNQRSIFLSWS
jgi:hypothetical protein